MPNEEQIQVGLSKAPQVWPAPSALQQASMPIKRRSNSVTQGEDLGGPWNKFHSVCLHPPRPPGA